MTCKVRKLKKILPSLIKLCFVVGYKFLIQILNFGFNRCICGHVIQQNMEFIRLAIFQPFLKIETSGLDQKKSLKLCAEHFTTLGVINNISGHVTGHQLF